MKQSGNYLQRRMIHGYEIIDLSVALPCNFFGLEHISADNVNDHVHSNRTSSSSSDTSAGHAFSAA